MRNAFVTGAYGLLGGWLCKALLDAGVHVVVLKRDEVPVSALQLEGTEARCAVVHGSVTDGELMARVLTEYDVDTVFHLAAQTIVGAANRSPISTFETNVRGTWLLLEACRTDGRVERVVVAASDKAYGPQRRAALPRGLRPAAALPLRRVQGRGRPHHPVVLAHLRAARWPSPASRTSTAAATPTRRGSSPRRSRPRWPGAAPSSARTARPSATTSTSRTPCRPTWPSPRALDDDGRARGEAFNAGSGRPWSVREVVELVCEAAGTRVEPDIRGTGTPAGEIDRQFVDGTKLREVTGWTPAVELRDGLVKTVDWYRSHPEALIE